MQKKSSLHIILFILLSVFLCGCNSNEIHPHTRQIYALDTVIDITAYGDNAKEAVSAAVKEIYRLEKLLSVTDKNSDTSKLNNSKGEVLSVNDDTYTLLTLAKSISAETKGMFDPTVYPVLKLWGFTGDEHKVPTEAEIIANLNKVNYENIILSEGNSVALQSGTEIDLGGIAKGYIADKAAKAMKDAGCQSGIISLGGNVRTIGQKTNGDNWKIGIKHPESNNYFATLSADDLSVITSGAYQRNFTVDGVIYHHILDPHTGKPSQSDALSVTIIGKNGAACDALSTAIFAGGSEFAANLQAKDFDYVILTKDNKVYVSEGLKESFSLSDKTSSLEVIYK